MTTPEAARLLRQNDNFVIFTHARPDGDTVGSAAALCRILRTLGKTAHVAPNPELTAPRLAAYVDGLSSGDSFEGKTLVCVDIASASLLPSCYAPLADGMALGLDHHPSNTLFAAQTLVEPTLAATGELVFALMRELDVPLTPEIALPLYLSLSTDTGCFRYSNTTAGTLRIAADLMETGIDAARVNREMFEMRSRRRLEIEAAIFSQVEFYFDDTVALIALSRDFIDRHGATEDDLDNLSALPRSIEGVEIGLLLKESAPGDWRLSVRSGAPWDAGRICAALGGGGHARASGSKMSGALIDVKTALLAAVRAELERA